jgi:hypothetical protein
MKLTQEAYGVTSVRSGHAAADANRTLGERGPASPASRPGGKQGTWFDVGRGKLVMAAARKGGDGAGREALGPVDNGCCTAMQTDRSTRYHHSSCFKIGCR